MKKRANKENQNPSITRVFTSKGKIPVKKPEDFSLTDPKFVALMKSPSQGKISDMFAHKLIVADQTKETTAREKREEEKEKRKREEKEKKKEEKQLTLFKKSVKFDMAALELVSAEQEVSSLRQKKLAFERAKLDALKEEEEKKKKEEEEKKKKEEEEKKEREEEEKKREEEKKKEKDTEDVYGDGSAPSFKEKVVLSGVLDAKGVRSWAQDNIARHLGLGSWGKVKPFLVGLFGAEFIEPHCDALRKWWELQRSRGNTYNRAIISATQHQEKAFLDSVSAVSVVPGPAITEAQQIVITRKVKTLGRRVYRKKMQPIFKKLDDVQKASSSLYQRVESLSQKIPVVSHLKQVVLNALSEWKTSESELRCDMQRSVPGQVAIQVTDALRVCGEAHKFATDAFSLAKDAVRVSECVQIQMNASEEALLLCQSEIDQQQAKNLAASKREAILNSKVATLTLQVATQYDAISLLQKKIEMMEAERAEEKKEEERRREKKREEKEKRREEKEKRREEEKREKKE